jgi:hypothetical protein
MCARVEGLQTARSVKDDTEVTRERWYESCGPLLWISLLFYDLARLMLPRKKSKANLIIDQSPLFQERVNSHDSTDISGQVASTGSDREVFHGTKVIGANHEVAVFLVDGWCFRPISRVEKLGESSPFYFVDFGHLEPGRVGWDDNLVCLLHQILSSLVLEAHPRSLGLGCVFFFVFFTRFSLFFSTFDHVYILLTFEWGRARFAACREFERGEVSNFSTVYGLELSVLSRGIFWIDGCGTLGPLLNGKRGACVWAKQYPQVTWFSLESPLLTLREMRFGTRLDAT